MKYTSSILKCCACLLGLCWIAVLCDLALIKCLLAIAAP